MDYQKNSFFFLNENTGIFSGMPRCPAETTLTVTASNEAGSAVVHLPIQICLLGTLATEYLGPLVRVIEQFATSATATELRHRVARGSSKTPTNTQVETNGSGQMHTASSTTASISGAWRASLDGAKEALRLGTFDFCSSSGETG